MYTSSFTSGSKTRDVGNFFAEPRVSLSSGVSIQCNIGCGFVLFFTLQELNFGHGNNSLLVMDRAL